MNIKSNKVPLEGIIRVELELFEKCNVERLKR